MEAKKAVLEPEKVIPAVEGLEVRLTKDEARTIAFGLRRAVEDQALLHLNVKAPSYALFKNATREELERLEAAFEAACPQVEGDAHRYDTYATMPAKPDAQGLQPPIELRALIKHIVKFLNQSTQESQELWNVLTALRGPDNKDRSLKQATTGIIRHKLGLDPNAVLIDVCKDDFASKQLRNRLTGPADEHFLNHAKSAFRALGLDWGQVNE